MKTPGLATVNALREVTPTARLRRCWLDKAFNPYPLTGTFGRVLREGEL